MGFRQAAACLIAAAALLPGTVCAQTASPGASPVAPSPAPSRTPYTGPTTSPAAAMTIARQELDAWKLGVVDRARYSPQVTDALTEDILQNVHTGLVAEGDVRSFTFVRSKVGDGFVGYTYAVVAAHGKYSMNIAIDDNGQISGVQFTPAQ